MNYSDAEIMMATQIAYLNCDGNGRDMNVNVGSLVDAILQQYGTYDRSTGTYSMKAGVKGAAEAQFKTAQNIIRLSEQNKVVSWRHWNIVNSCNKQNTSGYYGCLIETGERSAIVGCRGSESYGDQTWKDWGVADIGRLNNELTKQQADAAEYIEDLYNQYGDNYDSFIFTGHSLGGSLATHSAIAAPEGMQDKIEKVISYDGPGFSDEYLRKHQEQIKRVRDKLNHYEYSWVGSLLFQPVGTNDRVIKAHDDTEVEDTFLENLLQKRIFVSQLYRHATKNVEFDENGNVMDGERGSMQVTFGQLSKILEVSPDIFFPSVILLALASYVFSIGDQIGKNLIEAVPDIKEKAQELYNDYLSLMISGDYEIHTGKICCMVDDLESVERQLIQIADEVNEIRYSLPYDSVSAFYYKHCLGKVSNALESEGRKAGKISKAVVKAVSKYNQGDQKVSACF